MNSTSLLITAAVVVVAAVVYFATTSGSYPKAVTIDETHLYYNPEKKLFRFEAILTFTPEGDLDLSTVSFKESSFTVSVNATSGSYKTNTFEIFKDKSMPADFGNKITLQVLGKDGSILAETTHKGAEPDPR